MAERTRAESRAAVAGTFESHGDRLARPRPNLLQAQLQRIPDAAADLESPRRRVYGRDVEMDEQVMKPRRAHVIAQRLEGHAPISGREL